MAIYEYEILRSDGSARGIYEAEQPMSAPALTHHPETGEPLRRILSVTFAHGSKSHAPTSCESGTCGSDLPALGGGGCASGMCGCS